MTSAFDRPHATRYDLQTAVVNNGATRAAAGRSPPRCSRGRRAVSDGTTDHPRRDPLQPGSTRAPPHHCARPAAPATAATRTPARSPGTTRAHSRCRVRAINTKAIPISGKATNHRVARNHGDENGHRRLFVGEPVRPVHGNRIAPCRLAEEPNALNRLVAERIPCPGYSVRSRTPWRSIPVRRWRAVQNPQSRDLPGTPGLADRFTIAQSNSLGRSTNSGVRAGRARRGPPRTSGSASRPLRRRDCSDGRVLVRRMLCSDQT